MVWCITGSQSRLANDDGTWLWGRSLACLRGATEGGGTPDVDADRPSLQLTLGSELWFPANKVGLTEHRPILLVTTGGPGVPSHS